MKNLTHYLTRIKRMYTVIKAMLTLYANVRHFISHHHHESGLVEFYLADAIQINPKSFRKCDTIQALGEVILLKDGKFVAWCKADTWELMQEPL